MPSAPAAKVRANLILASNGATTLNGSSRPLSPKADRERFHLLRSGADVILIGGRTFNGEPYRGIATPLLVASRSLRIEEPGVEFHNCSPIDLVKLAKIRYQSILIEGGVNFLSGILAEKLINQFFLTRVNMNGDGNIFEERDLKDNYSLTSEETLDGLSFEIWEPNPQR
jgi:riboflavin biosynthesis pyrimidine reductase